MEQVDIETQARSVAQSHRQNDPDTTEVWWSPDPALREVRLVEVSSSVGCTGEVLPFRFGPDGAAMPYPTVVVLLSPEEMRDLREGTLSLPDSWRARAEDLRLLQ